MMIDIILYCTIIFIGEIVLISPFIFLSSQRNYRAILILFAIFLVDFFIILAPPSFSLTIGHWNWTGKGLSLLFSLLLIPLLKLSPQSIGLRLPQTSQQWRDTLLCIIVLVIYITALVFISGEPSSLNPLENWLFEASLPGMEEELLFRGIALVIISQAFPVLRFNIPAWVAPFTITTGLFTLGHLFNISHGHLSFHWLNALIEALPVGGILYLVRCRTGSVFSAMVSHNISNLTEFFLTTS